MFYDVLQQTTTALEIGYNAQFLNTPTAANRTQLLNDLVVYTAVATTTTTTSAAAATPTATTTTTPNSSGAATLGFPFATLLVAAFVLAFF